MTTTNQLSRIQSLKGNNNSISTINLKLILKELQNNRIICRHLSTNLLLSASINHNNLNREMKIQMVSQVKISKILMSRRHRLNRINLASKLIIMFPPANKCLRLSRIILYKTDHSSKCRNHLLKLLILAEIILPSSKVLHLQGNLSIKLVSPHQLLLIMGM